MTNSNGHWTSDLGGGAAATAILLPQAMAFGVALLGPAGVDAGPAALVGLVGGAALSLVSGAVGGTKGLISAPTGPVLILLTGVLAKLDSSDPAAAAAALMAVTFLTGVFQVIVGLLGGGRLIKFMPHAVVAGFMTGSAILMIKSQLPSLLGGGASFDVLGPWIPTLTAVTTIALVVGAKTWTPRIPAPVAGLLGGTIAFHVLSMLAPGAVAPSWVVGALPGPDSIKLGVEMSALHNLPWSTMIGSALALALLASLDTLLTSVIADATTGSRHNARRELIGQGLGQIVSGWLGGMPGAGTTGATVVAVQTGGRRWVGVFVGVFTAALILIGGGVGRLLPIGALAGIILHVAWGMIDRDIATWARRQRTRNEAIVALLVTAVTVVWDLMIAVGLGVAIAIGLFIRAQVQAPIVQMRATAGQRHSVVARTPEQRALLDEHKDEIVIYTLTGNLFFAKADQLFEQVGADLDSGASVIFDMRRVQQVDLTGVKLLQQMVERAHAAGGELCFCNVHRSIGIGHKIAKAIRKTSHVKTKGLRVRTFNGADEALEYCENKVIERHGQRVTIDTLVDFEDAEIAVGLSDTDRETLLTAMERHGCEKGDVLFEQGDDGDSLYIVVYGEVEVQLPTSEHHYKRLAQYGPGTFFGEVGLLRPGPRAARAVAKGPTELLRLSRPALEQLALDHPEIAVAVLARLGATLSAELRWTTSEMRRLAAW